MVSKSKSGVQTQVGLILPSLCLLLTHLSPPAHSLSDVDHFQHTTESTIFPEHWAPWDDFFLDHEMLGPLPKEKDTVGGIDSGRVIIMDK